MQTLDNGPAAQRPEALTSVAVLGGGLAGMAAAWRLVNAGYRVTLVERRPYLGGRAYSFVDRETGQEIDNGQHVFLGCCDAYRRFLDEIGSLELTSRQKRLHVEVRAPSGARGILSGLPLPAPFHLLPSLLRYPHVSIGERLRAIPALLLMWLERKRDRPALRRKSFHHWLRSHWQSERAIDAFWNLLIIPALNDSAEEVSASAGFMLFQEALLRDRNGGNIGFAQAGLSAIMGDAVRERLTGAGADVLLDRTADALVVEDGRVTGVRFTDGETLPVDACVSALPPDVLLRLLPEEVREHPAFAPAATHTWSPIVNLHVWYDRQIAEFEFLAFVDSPVQWVFNRTAIAGLEGPGQYITVSLSGAWEFWPMSKEALREKFIPELARLFPAAKDAEITRFVIVKEQRATFRSLPDAADNRLPSATPLPNLFLAGDWTDTGWPATMESAVRSGNIAAEAVGRNADVRDSSMSC
ncbi:MAG: FAD-dependent oxidoreductase [Chloroflexi bacterium]|nr:FAD-dependent oxidoreductase [Chloroflexota bacterium]